MRKKYRVEQNGQFLGHHRAHSPKNAIEKAILTYGPFYNINQTDMFVVTRGSKTVEIFIGEE